MEVWSIVFGGRGVGLRAALEPSEPVVIYSVTSSLCLRPDNEDERTWGGVRACVHVCVSQ